MIALKTIKFPAFHFIMYLGFTILYRQKLLVLDLFYYLRDVFKKLVDLKWKFFVLKAEKTNISDRRFFRISLTNK